MTLTHEALLREAYAAYNRCDHDALLALVSNDVDWPNSRERLHGKDQLLAYWVEHWKKVRTHDEPVKITRLAPDRSAVRISQVVRKLDGTFVSQGLFDHTYRIEHSLIARLDIDSVPISECRRRRPHDARAANDRH